MCTSCACESLLGLVLSVTPLALVTWPTCRLVESYKLMLAFYGLKLVNARTGEVKRSDEWAYRSQAAIVRSSHNHLRIARILACCNILGFRTYALRLLERLTFEVRPRASVL